MDTAAIEQREERQHGDVNTYAAGCHAGPDGGACDLCRKAWNDYMLKRRRRLGVRPRKPRAAKPAHKTLSAYYRHKTEQRSLSLTLLGAALLDRIKARTARSDGDIFEHYLRTYPDLAFDEAATAAPVQAQAQ